MKFLQNSDNLLFLSLYNIIENRDVIIIKIDVYEVNAKTAEKTPNKKLCFLVKILSFKK